MRLVLSEAHARQIAQHALDDRSHEACGIIGGIGEQAQVVIPVANIAADPRNAYRLDDRALVEAVHRLSRQGLSPIGFYHSHPNSDPIPSATDIAQAAYRHTPYLIVGLRGHEPRLAAWELNGNAVIPVELFIGVQPSSQEERLSRAQKMAIILSVVTACLFMLALSVTLLPPAPVIP
jgi:proteasome lid subunit RPN8/RPN11